MEDRRVKQEVKQETVEYSLASPENRVDDSFLRPISIDFSGSSNPGDGGGTVAGGKRDRVSIGLDGVLPKKTKLDGLGTVSVGSVAAAEPPIITSSTPTPVSQPSSTANTESRSIVDRSCKLFWKAGDYEGASDGDSGSNTGNWRSLFSFLCFDGVLTMLLFLRRCNERSLIMALKFIVFVASQRFLHIYLF